MKVGLLSVPFEFNPLKDVDGLRAQVSAKLVKEIAGCMLTGLRG